VLFENVSDGLLRDSRAVANTGTFLHVAGTNTKNIVVRNNLLARADKDITFESRSLQKVLQKS
jgi:hypothetical protein